MDVMVPLRKGERNDERIDVSDNPDYKRDREPRNGTAAPENQRHRDEERQSESAAGPGVIARVAAELCDIERVSSNLHRDKYGEELPVRANHVGMEDPDRGRDADVEDRVGDAVEASKSGRIHPETTRDLSVVDIRQSGNNNGSREKSSIGVHDGEQNADRAQREPSDRESERSDSSKLLRRIARPVITVVVLIAVAALAVQRIDWHVLAQSIAHASVPLVVAAGAVTFVSTLLKGVRWWLFLRKASDIPVGRVVRLTVLGTGANSVMFANAGDMIRVGLVAREARVPVATVVSALASDKVVEVTAFATVMIAALGSRLPGAVRDRVELVVIGLSLALVVAAIVTFTARGRISRWLSQTRDMLHWRTFLIAFAISLLSWAAQLATYAMGAKAVGLDVPLIAIVVGLVSVNVGGVIRTTPGNVGVFQLMFALALAPFGVANDPAVAAAVLIQSVQMLSSLVAGAVAASL